MNKVLAIIGIIISSIGIVASFKAAAPTALAVLALGFAVLGYAIWALYFRKAIDVRHMGYHYEFMDPTGKLVKIVRTERVAVNVPQVTTLWARSLTTTGKFENFASNIGQLSIEESTGGGKNVRVDFERPLKRDEEIEWILTYGVRNGFAEQAESVSLNSIYGSRTAEITIRYHPNRVPKTVRRTLFIGGQERELGEPLVPNDKVPTVTWRFRPRVGGEYSLHWRYDEGADK